MPNSLQTHGLYSPWTSPGQNIGVSSLSLFSGDLPNPGIEPRSPALQADSLPAEPQGKPKNAGMGSLSLLQQTFLTQESNWSLLHCRWILYQLSYWGSSLKEWTNIHLMVKILLSHSNPHIKSFVQCVVVIGGS